MKTGITPTKAAGRRAKSAAGGHGATDLHRQILNCDRVNALPAAAREHEHFYLLLFRNLIRQLTLLLVFCTMAVVPACGDEISGRFFFQGVSRGQPGANSTFCRKNGFVAKTHSCARCNGLIRATSAAHLSQSDRRQNTGGAPEPGTRENRHAWSARDVLTRQHGGAGTNFETTSDPVTTFNCYE